MINNWDLISRVDTDGTIHYSLVIDGTEQDARLVARKLKGYIKGVKPANAPYVYNFELPQDIDESTQDKIRAAAQEGVDLTNKVNQFIPGGALGDPLFSANALAEDKAFPTFLTLDPSTSFLEKEGETVQKKPQLDLSFVTQLGLENSQDFKAHQVSLEQNDDGTIAAKATEPNKEFSTTIREAFATKAPQEEFTLPDNELPPPPPPSKQTEKSAIPQVNLDKQPTQKSSKELPPSTISINESDMLIKDMEGSVLEKMPVEDILKAKTKYDVFKDVGKNPEQDKQFQNQKEQKINSIQDTQHTTFNVFEQELKDVTNTLEVDDVKDITDQLPTKNGEYMRPSNPSENINPQNSPKEKTNISSQETKQQTQNIPFTLGSAEEKKSILSDLSSETLPKEEKIENTQIKRTETRTEDLPEITVRTERTKLDKTFNLETTFNTEVIKREHEKNQALQEGRPAPLPIQEEDPHIGKTILRLKKQAQQQPVQSEEEMGKTMLRLRPKQAETAPQTPQPLKSTVSPQRSAEQARLAKQNAIDHSIQIPTSELKKHNWPLEVPLVPTYTLNNMVMSVNRFAHATAISVIDAPGKVYNPLVLHGGTGTGKTHFLNALAYAFSQKFGQEHIFMTNGVRLSRGIQRYVMEGNIAKFNKFMESVQVLLIDDVHLLAINEQNRQFVSQLLNSFVKQQKQIVITSKYPPESLAKLEELIDFKLDSGWISELKPTTGATHFRIVKKMLLENGVDLNDNQIESFFGDSHMTLGTVTRSIRRVKVLENLITTLTKDQKSQAGLLEKLLATQGEDQTSELVSKDPQEITSLTTVGNGEWGRIGFFYPQNCSEMMNWMVYALQQRAKELGIEGGFDIVVRSSYATENIISSAFKIANLCDNKKLKGAVILGPKPNSCDPSVRENFYDILTHMLEIMLIRCGIINYENVRLPSTYVKVISELMR